MYFISEKDGQNVQIELASAFVIFFPSTFTVFLPTSRLLFFSMCVSPVLCIMLTVHMFDFYSRDQIHTYLYVKYGNVCRRDDGHRDGNHTMPIDWYLLYNVSGVLFRWLCSAGSVPRMYLTEISVTILLIFYNDEIENGDFW